MALMWSVVSDCIKQIRKAILQDVDPAGTKGGKWKPHKNSNGESLLLTGETSRLFDVISAGLSPETITFGTSADDDKVIINIVIGYSVKEEYNHLAQSDYRAIRYQLHNIDVSAVTGLHYYEVQPFEWQANDDFRYLIIPVVAQIQTTVN